MNHDADPQGLVYAVRLVLVWMFYITIWHGVRAWVGDETLSNLNGAIFGEYIAVWNKHAPALPPKSNPYMQMLIGVVGMGVLFNFKTLGRYVGAAVAAFFLWGAIFTHLSKTSEFAPSPLLIGAGIGSIFFLVVSSLMVNTRGRGRSTGGFSRVFNWMRS